VSGDVRCAALAVAVANGEASRVERLQFGRLWRVCTARERQRDSTACHKAALYALASRAQRLRLVKSTRQP
jgi:hypothetical protein